MADPWTSLTPQSVKTLTAGAPGAHAPAPGFFETIGKSFSQAGAAPDWGLNQSNYEDAAYTEMRSALVAKGWKEPTYMFAERDGGATARIRQADLIAAVQQFRKGDPTFLPDFANVHSQDDVTALARARRNEKAGTLGVELQDAGWTPWLIGQIGHGLTDPTSYIPVGGTGKVAGSVVGEILGVAGREAAANAALATALEPLVRHDSAQQGVERTLGETLTDIGLQGVTGGAIGGAAKGLELGFHSLVPPDPGKDIGQAIDHIVSATTWDPEAMGRYAAHQFDPSGPAPTPRSHAAGTAGARAAAHDFAQAVPPDQRTPTEQAALNASDRASDVAEDSPNHATPEGDDHHASLFDQALDDLANGRAPRDGPPLTVQSYVDAYIRGEGREDPHMLQFAVNNGPAIEAEFQRRAAAPRAAPAGNGGLPADIVQFFRDRGYSEHQARGIAAGIVAESRGDHSIRNPDSDAMGLGQWLGSRKAELQRRYGPNPTRRQQLEFIDWELRGGDHGGAAVLAAADEAGVLDAYIRKFMRPAAGAETTGDLSRGMAALGRGEEAFSGGGLFGDDAAQAPPDNRAATSAAFDQVRSDAMSPSETIAAALLGGETYDFEIARFDPRDLEIDAPLMQFRHGGDDRGVVDTYRNVNRWNSLMADPITVWIGNDGRHIVADGHQRMGIAMRSLDAYPDHPVRMLAQVIRESDGYSARDARVLAAFRNVGQGHGTALDFAKLLAETGGRLPPGIDLAKAALRDARGISRLQGEALTMAFNEAVPHGYSAIVGQLMPEGEARQVALIRLLQETQPASATQAASIVRDGIDAGFETVEQFDLFGADTRALSKMKKRAQILDDAMGILNKRKFALSTAAREADIIEASGSHIARDAAKQGADANAQALEILAALAGRHGPVSDALNAAVDSLTLGVKRAQAARDFADAVSKIDIARLADDAGTGGPAGELGLGDEHARRADAAAAGDGGQPAPDGDPAVRAAVAAADAEEAASARLFDDPGGKAAAEQATLARHDVEMAAPQAWPSHWPDGSWEVRDSDGMLMVQKGWESGTSPKRYKDEAAAMKAAPKLVRQDGQPRMSERSTVPPAIQEALSHPIVGEVDGEIGFAGQNDQSFYWKDGRLEIASAFPDQPSHFRSDPDGARFVRKLNETLAAQGQPNVMTDAARQEAQLRATSPLRPGAVDAEGTMGLGLFDVAEQPTFRMEVDGEEQGLGDFLAEIDADRQAAEELKRCLQPKGGDA